MYRTAMEQLYRWKNRTNRKPLIIRGARQVGKTWLMKAFGAEAYQQCLYYNFESNLRLKELFKADLNTERLIRGLELYAAQKIDKQNTLLVFDEIQEVPEALTSLKYFHENAPEYQIICAGSLLGIALHSGTSFPVGKVEFIDLYPLSFTEFLLALRKEQFVDLLTAADFQMITAFKHEYIDLLRQFFFLGGMPEVVHYYADNRDFNEARMIQERILAAYEQDFSKHAPTEIVPRIRALWNSLPAQLSREKRKFVYSHIREGARAREFEMALLWLADCGLIHKVHRATAPRLPLTAYQDAASFKVFMVDVGLLACMAGLRQEMLLEGNELFQEFKGALTEQYVYQQLRATTDLKLFYWTNDQGNAEIDFIADNGRSVMPIEVKAEVNLQAKSLKVYRDKFNPALALRCSLAGYRSEGWLTNLPLYALSAFPWE